MVGATAARPPYSHRGDPDVPAFDDARGLIVFDGTCVFCSGFARFVAGRDKDAYFQFAAAQGRLGQALFRHHQLDPDDYESNLVIDDGRVFVKLDTVAAVARHFRGPWKALAILSRVPGFLGGPVYDVVARHRYRIFGRRDVCAVPSGDLGARFIDDL